MQKCCLFLVVFCLYFRTMSVHFRFPMTSEVHFSFTFICILIFFVHIGILLHTTTVPIITNTIFPLSIAYLISYIPLCHNIIPMAVYHQNQPQHIRHQQQPIILFPDPDKNQQPSIPTDNALHNYIGRQITIFTIFMNLNQTQFFFDVQQHQTQQLQLLSTNKTPAVQKHGLILTCSEAIYQYYAQSNQRDFTPYLLTTKQYPNYISFEFFIFNFFYLFFLVYFFLFCLLSHSLPLWKILLSFISFVFFISIWFEIILFYFTFKDNNFFYLSFVFCFLFFFLSFYYFFCNFLPYFASPHNITFFLNRYIFRDILFSHLPNYLSWHSCRTHIIYHNCYIYFSHFFCFFVFQSGLFLDCFSFFNPFFIFLPNFFFVFFSNIYFNIHYWMVSVYIIIDSFYYIMSFSIFDAGRYGNCRRTYLFIYFL